MKRLRLLITAVLFTLLACAGAGIVSAQENVESVSITMGSFQSKTVSFRVEGFDVSNPSIIKVQVNSKDGRTFSINAVTEGITDLRVYGQGMVQNYKVQVVKDLRPVYNALRRDLDALPEIDISLNNDHIVLRGVISSIPNQELKDKVLKMYSVKILDLTTYNPTPEVMKSLQRNLEQAGFRVLRLDATMRENEPGAVSIAQVGEGLTITGTVYSPEDLARIHHILAGQAWIDIGKEGSGGRGGRISAYVNVQVLPVMLQVDIVHVAVTRQQLEKIGIDWSEFVDNGFMAGTKLLWSINKLKDVAAQQNAQAAFGVGTNQSLAAALSLLGQTSVSRARRGGTLTFLSDGSSQSRTLHNGGTLYVSSDSVSGGSSSLEEVKYGLMLSVTGGLTGVDNVKINLNQELSFPSPLTETTSNAKIDLKQYSTSSTLSFKLGETVVVGGLKDFTQNHATSGSIPYLRNIPVINWCISQNKDVFLDDEILTLVCVHKIGKAKDIDYVEPQLEKMRKVEDEKYRSRREWEEKKAGKWYEFWGW